MRTASLSASEFFKALQRNRNASCLAKLLRVADSRSGARLCEPQQRPNFKGASIYFARALPGEAAAGRRPALRTRRYFLAITATFIDAGNVCWVGGSKPACASMSEYSANV